MSSEVETSREFTVGYATEFLDEEARVQLDEHRVQRRVYKDW